MFAFSFLGFLCRLFFYSCFHCIWCLVLANIKQLILPLLLSVNMQILFYHFLVANVVLKNVKRITSGSQQAILQLARCSIACCDILPVVASPSKFQSFGRMRCWKALVSRSSNDPKSSCSREKFSPQMLSQSSKLSKLWMLRKVDKMSKWCGKFC